MSVACPLCDGACVGADLPPLLDERLAWLWEQIGRAADRRGDSILSMGILTLQAPAGAEERAAATGLVGARVLTAGQKRRIDLAQLTQRLRVRGAQLTPGVVAAHALGRRLASRAIAREQRRQDEQTLLLTFHNSIRALSDDALGSKETVWNALRRTGWVARLLRKV